MKLPRLVQAPGGGGLQIVFVTKAGNEVGEVINGGGVSNSRAVRAEGALAWLRWFSFSAHLVVKQLHVGAPIVNRLPALVQENTAKPGGGSDQGIGKRI